MIDRLRTTRACGVRRLCLTLACLALLGLVVVNPAGAGDGNRGPELTGDCAKLQVEAGNKVAYHTYASGVQIYRWNGTAWAFVAPDAALFADAGGQGVVGTHYAGPTWESNSGSKVVGAVEQRCTPDPTAIDWLRLKATSSEGPGIFDGITFILRVNTTGGKAPATPGAVGDVARIPYTAEYYFYRASNNTAA